MDSQEERNTDAGDDGIGPPVPKRFRHDSAWHYAEMEKSIASDVLPVEESISGPVKILLELPSELLHYILDNRYISLRDIYLLRLVSKEIYQRLNEFYGIPHLPDPKQALLIMLLPAHNKSAGNFDLARCLFRCLESGERSEKIIDSWSGCQSEYIAGVSVASLFCLMQFLKKDYLELLSGRDFFDYAYMRKFRVPPHTAISALYSTRAGDLLCALEHRGANLGALYKVTSPNHSSRGFRELMRKEYNSPVAVNIEAERAVFFNHGEFRFLEGFSGGGGRNRAFRSTRNIVPAEVIISPSGKTGLALYNHQHVYFDLDAFKLKVFSGAFLDRIERDKNQFMVLDPAVGSHNYDLKQRLAGDYENGAFSNISLKRFMLGYQKRGIFCEDYTTGQITKLREQGSSLTVKVFEVCENIATDSTFLVMGGDSGDVQALCYQTSQIGVGDEAPLVDVSIKTRGRDSELFCYHPDTSQGFMFHRGGVISVLDLTVVGLESKSFRTIYGPAGVTRACVSPCGNFLYVATEFASLICIPINGQGEGEGERMQQ